MPKSTADEKRVYGKTISEAARFANLALAAEGFIEGEYAVDGRFELDRKRQPTFLLEPISLFAGYPFPQGTQRILEGCIRLAIDNNLEEFVRLSIEVAFTTRDTKTKATRPDKLEQMSLF